MSEPLSATELERMRREHVTDETGCCERCCHCFFLEVEDMPENGCHPCDAALLLTNLAWVKQEPCVHEKFVGPLPVGVASIRPWLHQEEWAERLEAQGYTKERDGVYSKPRPEFGAAGIGPHDLADPRTSHVHNIEDWALERQRIAFGLLGPATNEELT